MKSSNGFSLIELLAATVILGLLITVVLTPLTQLFQNTRRSNQVLRTSTQAQQVIEHIRGQWQSYPVEPDIVNGTPDVNAAKRVENKGKYDKTCYEPLPNISGLTNTFSVSALDENADVAGALSLSANCTTATTSPSPPPIKRVTVNVRASDGSQSTLTIDIRDPDPDPETW